MVRPRPLLDLPAEIRHTILEALLVPRSWKEAAHFTVILLRDREGRVYSEHGGLFPESNTPKIHPEILRTSRQISSEGLPILYSRNQFHLLQRYYDPRNEQRTVSKENEECFNTMRKFLAQITPQNVARIRHLVMPGDSIFLEGSEVADFVSRKMTIGVRDTSLLLLLSDHPSLKNLETMTLYWGNICHHELSEDSFLDHLGLYDVSCTAWLAQDDAKIMAITAEVNDFVMKWAFLRAIAVIQQFLPALAHIYDVIPIWTRYLLVSLKPILGFESCDQLRYAQRIESLTPVEADVQIGSIKRLESKRVAFPDE